MSRQLRCFSIFYHFVFHIYIFPIFQRLQRLINFIKIGVNRDTVGSASATFYGD